MENLKSGMYIPIYYSNLYKAVPEGEDILYSLFTKVILIGTDTGFGRQKKIWHSHLLITSKGLYFAKYQWRKQPRVKFISWLMVKEIRGNKIKSIKPRFILKPKRERNLESRRNYQIRKKKITKNIQRIMQQGKKIILDEFIEKKSSFMQMTERERNLLKYVLKDQYLDDFKKKVGIIDKNQGRLLFKIKHNYNYLKHKTYYQIDKDFIVELVTQFSNMMSVSD